MTPDTVFDSEMRVVFHNTPDTVMRRLKAPHPSVWSSVLMGESQKMMTIPEYVNREKFAAVLEMVTDLTHKGRLQIFSDRPERLEAHILKTVREIVKVMAED